LKHIHSESAFSSIHNRMLFQKSIQFDMFLFVQ
jgi:hypothetical protein